MDKEIMKKIAATVLILSSFLFIFSYALNNSNIERMNINNEWNKILTNSFSFFKFSDILQVENGYIIVGFGININFSIKTFVIEVDENGNEIWNKTYGNNENMFLRSIIKDDNGYL
ncbi:MAG: hypothetical protein DRN17_04960, partial [Thermoplasmata archaeon]